MRTASTACAAGSPGRVACRRTTATSSSWSARSKVRWSGPCSPIPEPSGNIDFGGSLNAIEMIRWPSASFLPVRRKNGTSAQRQLSTKHLSAMNVSVSESGSTPSSVVVAGVLAADHVVRVDRQHRPEDLVLLLGDRLRVERGRRLHRGERQHLEEVGDHHVAVGAGASRRTPTRPSSPSFSGMSIWTWSMKLRCQIGSNSPLAKRNARMLSAASLPRKWSMRKICDSSKTSWRLAFSDLALTRGRCRTASP